MVFSVVGLSGHREPEAQVRRVGEYETLDEAVTAAKRTIDFFLFREFKPGMSSQALFSRYQERGEYPSIFRDDDQTLDVQRFNHLDYALIRCLEICGGKWPR